VTLLDPGLHPPGAIEHLLAGLDEAFVGTTR
jgi:hypothetical protein